MMSSNEARPCRCSANPLAGIFPSSASNVGRRISASITRTRVPDMALSRASISANVVLPSPGMADVTMTTLAGRSGPRKT